MAIGAQLKAKSPLPDEGLFEDEQPELPEVSFRVQEIFGPTIQGEGALVGKPTLFIRLGGCDYRCAWCDTIYAVDISYKDTWKRMTVQAILDACTTLFTPKFQTPGMNRMWVTLSGGNPVLQPIRDLIIALQRKGFYVTIETQGAPKSAPFDRTAKWAPLPEHVCLSPKPPSSGMSDKTQEESLHEIIVMREPAYKSNAGVTRTSMKIVIMDEEDLNWAYGMYERFSTVPFYLQVGNPKPGNPSTTELIERYRWLIEVTFKRGWHGPTLLPQVHALLWGNERGR